MSTDPDGEDGDGAAPSDAAESKSKSESEVSGDRPPGPDGQFAQRLVAKATDAIVTVGAGTEVVYANPSAGEMFGRPPAALVGEPLAVLVDGSAAGRLRAAVEAHLAGDHDHDHEEWRNVRLPVETGDGGRRRVSVSLFAHPDGDGERRVSGVFRDVTDRSRRERELERENERLSRLASVLSHDLREPLNNARAKLTLARETGDEEYIDEALAINSRMADLVDDVLSFTASGDEITDTERVELAAVVDDARRIVGAQSVDVVVADSVSVRGDPDRLQTLFENLLTNAVRHAGPDVRVRIGPLSDEEGFFVADDGPGIPENERDRVFEYSYTTSDHGTGMGLAIVRKIARAHGWSVRAAESADGGVRIEFAGVEMTADGGG